MTSDLKPLHLYGHSGGPNPWKVLLILSELSLPYTHEILEFSAIKGDTFLSINPNGRVPALRDPNNNDLTLWESGAIIEYIIATYDQSHKLSYPPNSVEDWHCKQYLHFQMSGQGPYFGQGVWFTNYHQDKVARDRYKKESERVTSVLNTALERNGGKALVGDKLTYADWAFVPWACLLPHFWRLEGEKEELDDMLKKYPVYGQWVQSMTETESFKKIWEGERVEAMKNHKI